MFSRDLRVLTMMMLLIAGGSRNVLAQTEGEMSAKVVMIIAHKNFRDSEEPNKYILTES